MTQVTVNVVNAFTDAGSSGNPSRCVLDAEEFLNGNEATDRRVGLSETGWQVLVQFEFNAEGVG